MQTRSSTWEMLALTGDFYLEAKAIIGETEYTAITAPIIDRALFQGSPTVGNCVAASMSVSIRTTDTFPKGAEVQIKMRLWNETRTVSTEWLPAGTFYIQKRQTDYSTDLVTLTCYDAMLKGADPFYKNDPQVDLTGWPLPMADVVDYIADRMGVDVDPRTTMLTGDAYQITATPAGQLNEALGHIGACMGGNWCITPEGKLRLVPLQNVPASPAEDTRAKLVTEMGTVYPRFAAVDSNNVEHYGEWSLVDGELVLTNDDPDPITDLDVRAILSRLGTSKNLTITGVTMTDDIGSISYTAGTDTGYMLAITGNPYASQAICTALYTALNGLEYHPFDAESTIYDPAAELGDAVYYRNVFRGRLISEKATLDLAFHGNIGAPASQEVEDEYPYKTPAQKVLEKSAAMADDARKEAVNYLSRDDSGIMVAPMSDDNRYTPSNVPTGVKNTFIDNDSFDVRDGQTVLASFGETSQVGKETENHQVIDGNGITCINGSGETVFDINMQGYNYHFSKKWLYTNQSKIVRDSTDNTLTVDNLAKNYMKPWGEVIFRYGFHLYDEDGNAIDTPLTAQVAAHTFQGATPDYALYSIRKTEDVRYAILRINFAIDTFGMQILFESWALEEGYYFEIYPERVVSIWDLISPTFSLGTRGNNQKGQFSVIAGGNLSASSDFQFACGKYNSEDATYAFMIGNGDETNGDSNAFAVTWDGNQLIALDENASTGTDADLYAAITALGWENEVIVCDCMIDLKKLLTAIITKLKFTPTLLDNSKYECTQTGTTYEYSYISGMDDYNVIAVNFVAYEAQQTLYFVRPLPGEASLTDSPSIGRFRGTIRVDWENSSVGIRCISAGTAGTRYDLVYFKGVYGIA